MQYDRLIKPIINCTRYWYCTAKWYAARGHVDGAAT